MMLSYDRYAEEGGTYERDSDLDTPHSLALRRRYETLQSEVLPAEKFFSYKHEVSKTQTKVTY